MPCIACQKIGELLVKVFAEKELECVVRMEGRKGNGRRKCRAESKAFCYRLESFGSPSCPSNFGGTFVDNMEMFLQHYARKETSSYCSLPIWSVSLKADDSCWLSMFVLQEIAETSTQPHCLHCIRIGWGQHWVSRSKYHFIIPANDEVYIAHLQTMRTPELKSHLLHGLLHSNGYGHLITINGRQQKSIHTTGTQLMDLWDRTCAMLRVRKVSLRDISRKRSMELRLTHSLAYGMTWFGKWGYVFGRGTYGITRERYMAAIESLRATSISMLVQSQEAVSMVSMYQSLCGFALSTVGDLLSFMMELRVKLPANNINLTKPSTTPPAPGRWPMRRLEFATRVIIEALKRKNTRWVSRLELRDSARAYIGDTGLLDFVLKSIGNCIVGSHIVLRATNPITKILEYRLEDVSCIKQMSCMSKGRVARDIAFVYNYLLECCRTEAASEIGIPAAIRIILDTQNFVKVYHEVLPPPSPCEYLLVTCRAYVEEVRHDDMAPSYADVSLLLPPHATLGDLKHAANKAFHVTHYVTRHFHAESLLDFDGHDQDLVFPLLDVGSTLVLQGSGIDMGQELQLEGGLPKYFGEVDCPCGTKEDDGERFMACNVCNVWRHARCVGIGDVDDVPEFYLCTECALEELPGAWS